jgi:hypothetical protein
MNHVPMFVACKSKDIRRVNNVRETKIDRCKDDDDAFYIENKITDIINEHQRTTSNEFIVRIY